MLAPARGEASPHEPMADYARKLAAFIALLKTELGVEIQVTGIANEPQGFTPAQVAECVRALRTELNARGCQTVGIIAPESASANGSGLQMIKAIKADPVAWAALRGIATHSYNMAAAPEFAESIAGTGKEYWQTEAGDNGHEEPADVDRATETAARFVNSIFPACDCDDGDDQSVWLSD